MTAVNRDGGERRRIVVISSGLSQPSSTRLLADRLSAAVAAALAARGQTADVRVVELREHARDIANALVTGFPSGALRDALDAVAGAHGVIAVTPTFRASYSGLFKSFIDVLDDDPLAGKPVLIAATGGSARHSLVLDHAMRPVFAYLRAVVVPTSVFAATEDWSGEAQSAPLRSRIERAAAELAEEISRREPAKVADPFELATSFDDLLAASDERGFGVTNGNFLL
jgi:FMN reductase